MIRWFRELKPEDSRALIVALLGVNLIFTTIMMVMHAIYM
jgi:hypothetical protein